MEELQFNFSENEVPAPLSDKSSEKPPPKIEEIKLNGVPVDDVPFHEAEEVLQNDISDEETKTALTIQDKLNQIPAKFDLNKQKIQAWHDKYTGIEVFDEKGEIISENYKVLKEGKQLYVKARTTSDNVGKKEKEEARLYIDGVNGYINELHSFIKEGEEIVAKKIKEADELKEKRKKEKEQMEAAQLNERIVTIMSFGATYVGDGYVKGSITIPPALLKDMDEQSFQQLRDSLKLIYDKEQAEKKQAEYEQKRKADELEQEKRDFEEKQAAFKKQQEEAAEKQRLFEQQQADFKAQQDKAEADRKAAEDKAENDRKEEEKRKADELGKTIQLRKSTRINELMALGLGFSMEAGGYAYKDVNVSMIEVTTIDPEPWAELISKITPLVAARKRDEEERKLKEKADNDKKIADEAAAKGKKEAEDKAEAEKVEAENKRISDEKEAKRLEELKPDKEKLIDFAKHLSNMELPDIHDEEAFKILNGATELLNKISVYILNNVEGLK